MKELESDCTVFLCSFVRTFFYMRAIIRMDGMLPC